MPVEIRELLIKTTVEGSGPKKPAENPEAATEGVAEEPKPAASPKEEGQSKMRERILKECLNLVMDNFSSLNKER